MRWLRLPLQQHKITFLFAIFLVLAYYFFFFFLTFISCLPVSTSRIIRRCNSIALFCVGGTFYTRYQYFRILCFNDVRIPFINYNRVVRKELIVSNAYKLNEKSRSVSCLDEKKKKTTRVVSLTRISV